MVLCLAILFFRITPGAKLSGILIHFIPFNTTEKKKESVVCYGNCMMSKLNEEKGLG